MVRVCINHPIKIKEEIASQIRVKVDLLYNIITLAPLSSCLTRPSVARCQWWWRWWYWRSRSGGDDTLQCYDQHNWIDRLSCSRKYKLKVPFKQYFKLAPSSFSAHESSHRSVALINAVQCFVVVDSWAATVAANPMITMTMMRRGVTMRPLMIYLRPHFWNKPIRWHRQLEPHKLQRQLELKQQSFGRWSQLPLRRMHERL